MTKSSYLVAGSYWDGGRASTRLGWIKANVGCLLVYPFFTFLHTSGILQYVKLIDAGIFNLIIYST